MIHIRIRMYVCMYVCVHLPSRTISQAWQRTALSALGDAPVRLGYVWRTYPFTHARTFHTPPHCVRIPIAVRSTHTHTHAHSLSLSGGGPHNNVGITSWMSRVAEPGETCWRATLVPRRQRKRRRDDGNATRGSRGYSGTTDRCRRRVQRRVCVTTHEVYIYIYIR